MQFCSRCGAQNTATAKFCAQCGYTLTGGLSGGAPQGIPAPPAASPPGVLGTQSLLHNRYVIIRMLGQGGMGAVYLAQDRNAFNRRCVVKEMLPYYASPAEKLKAEKDFEREARVLATLRYDGVPQVYEYFIEGSKYYLVMEFVEGENLEERIARLGGRLPVDEALDYGLQLANTLVYLAKQTSPVIHRDIKPANIILDEDQNKVKLVDFGLAKESASSGMTGTLSAPLGTPGYAPMEQYTNLVEPRTDVYALGATLHHLVTGRDPRAETPFDFPPLRAYLPGVNSELEELIARMTATKVVDRPSALDVRDGLEALVRPRSVGGVTGVKPFTFRSGAVAYDASELALLCDQHWDDGIHHLYSGHFEAWLDAVNRHDLAVRAESIRVAGGNQSAGLEEFLRAANPTIPLPSLAVSAHSLNLGAVEKGAVVSQQLHIKNAGRGCLYGRIVPKTSWAVVRPLDFSLMANEELDLTVNINTGLFDEGAFDQPAFEINSNGGREAIDCQAMVSWQPAMTVEPKRRLLVGEVMHDQLQPVTAALVIRNTGGGVLQGRLAADQPWLTFAAAEFTIPSGGSVAIDVTAAITDATLQMSNSVIRIESNAGGQEVVASVGVRRDWYDRPTRIKRWLAYGALVALGGAGLVFGVGLAMIVLLMALVTYFRTVAISPPTQAWYWLVLLTIGGAGIGVAALFFSRRWVAQLDEMENYYHGQDLAAELVVSRFRWRKVIALSLYGVLLGGVASWRYSGDNDLFLSVITVLVAALGGALLGLAGAPGPALPASPPWLARLWRGDTLDTSQTFIVLRTGGLMAAGAWLGMVIASERFWIGIVIGLLLSSETHRFYTLRLRWLLDRVRVALVVGGGLFFTLGIYWMARGLAWHAKVIEGYSYISLSFPGLGWLLLLGLTTAIGIGGALGGLWVVDNVNLPRPQAQRLLLGVTGVLMLVSFPVYLFASLVFGLLLPRDLADALAFFLTAVTIVAGAWGLFTWRSQVEAASRRAKGVMAQGVSQSVALTRSAQGRIQQQAQLTGGYKTPSWLMKIRQRMADWMGRIAAPVWLRTRLGSFALPSLAEMEAQTPASLVAAAGVVALLLQELVARLVVAIAVGMGIVFFYLLLGVALVIGVRMAYLYFRRRRHP